MIRLTRRYRFAAAHRLHVPALSDAENRSVYGKCNNPRGHGHNYVLEVMVSGPVDRQTGVVADVEALDCLVQQTVLRALDHRNMNREVPEFSNSAPTTENLALVIRRMLSAGWAQVFPGPFPVLAGLRIHETRKNVFEVSERT